MGEDFEKLAYYSGYLDKPGITKEPKKSLFDVDAVTEHRRDTAKPIGTERDPTPDELLQAGDVREELHDLPTVPPIFVAEDDAIDAERRLQAELQRIMDEGAHERALMASWADAGRRESERRQNIRITATIALRRVGLGNGGTEGKHFVKPEGSYETPKASKGFEVASKRCHIPKADLPKARGLLRLANGIRAALAKDDKATAGRLLVEVKESGLLDHGEFLPWLKRFGLTPRTAQRYIELASAK